MSGPDVDVLVAGGGPVGLAAAVECRRRGLTVAVVEPRATPVDKACGEGLMPSAVAALERLGVVLDGRPFVGIRYLRDGWSAEARFRSGHGLGVRRTALHEALVQRARQVGAEQVHGRVDEVVQRGDRVEAAGLRASWLLAADGLHSPVRRALGLTAPSRGALRYGLRRHYRTAPWSNCVEVHWSPRVEAYVTPVADTVVGVAVLGPRGTGHAAAVAELPELAARLRDAEPVSAVLGAGPLRQRARAVRLGRVLLVGDAAGYVDALTGEGLASGLRSARAAGAAVAADRPQDYPAEWSRATRRYRVVTESLLAVTSRSGPRSLLVPVAARFPGAFARVVDLLA